MSRRVIVIGKVKPIEVEPKRKRVLNGRQVTGNRPEANRPIHGQGEAERKPLWKPEPFRGENLSDELWIGVKG